MWWQLFIVLVAASAASADDAEDQPNCMTLLHNECENENENKPEGIPGNDEELEEFCKYLLKYLNCSDRVFSSCGEENSAIAQHLKESGVAMRKICTGDLRTTVAEHLPCFKRNFEEIRSCDEKFHFDREVFTDGVSKITRILDSEDSPSIRCVRNLYSMGCTAATTGLRCDDAAKDVLVNLAQELDTPFEFCPKDAKQKLPEIVELMLLELKAARAVEDALKRKK